MTGAASARERGRLSVCRICAGRMPLCSSRMIIEFVLWNWEVGGGGEGGGKAAARESAGCNTVHELKPSTTKTATARFNASLTAYQVVGVVDDVAGP
jgi:hypothetical protein